ncbi:TraB/GumN family protein [Parvularcula dongshanensis]|uniref:TraB/GumN family protein n=1 Tax=Parvularcula dongshanensis TaxID=1173995 RepID=A0A840I1B5_9PROT|nr:TraB/GumN family protein [Parvularcula dongshanensis]MBB4657988.1 hypothetical protein [Parvularcula dongshanensis]
MTKIRHWLASASVLMLAACAQSPAQQAEAEESLPPYETPESLAAATQGESDVAMWRVGDEDTTVYLLGTVHLLRQGTAWQNDAFDTAFAAADTIYLEADVTSPAAQAEMQQLVPQLGMNPQGVTLSSYYDEEELAQLNTALEPLGVTVAQFDPFRPWLAGLTIGVLSLQKIGGDPAAGVEMLIAADAAEAGKTMRFFETPEQQIRMLAEGEDEEQADYLLESAEDLSDMEGFYARLIGAWYDGRPDVVGDTMNEAFKEVPGVAETLLYARNRNWADELETLIETEEGTFLVAVGAGHLAGDNSLQDYLEEKGYEAERL